MAEQLRKSKELTQKVGPSLNETDSEDSDGENIEVSEQVIDPENPWLAERKEFKDFMEGYTNFVQNNSETIKKDNQNEEIKFIEEHNKIIETNKNSIDEKNNDEIIEFINENENKKNKKVKHINIEDISILSDEESDVEVLQIINPKQKKKVTFSNNSIQPKTKLKDTNTKLKESNKNINIDSTNSNNKESNNVEVIHTVAGTWLVSTDNINVNSKQKKTHRDVENVFKTVETELKNKINKKLENLNKVKVSQSSHKNTIKHKHQTMNDDYLKISNKRSKTEFNEPLYEDNKALDQISSCNLEDNQGLSSKIVDKPTKAPQNIDPTEFLKVTQTSLETEDMAQIEDHLDDNDNNDQEKLIAEAFADDNIINEFKYVYKLRILF